MFPRGLKKLLIGCLALMIAAPAPAVALDSIPQDKSAAVIFLYFRIGDDHLPESNLRLDQFEEHINELRRGDYNVLPVPEILQKIKSGAELPPRTVGLTFDGAYRSTLENAVPLLKEAGFPFTLFFASDHIDSGTESYMTWAELRALNKDGKVTLGILPASYDNMVRLDAEQNRARLNRAVKRYRDEFGREPKLFSYPYGEYGNAVKEIIDAYEFDAAFGQNSGVAHGGVDMMALPRFSMTETYGDIDRFRLTGTALPLPVADLVPEDFALDTARPVIGFSVASDLGAPDRLSCFAAGQGRVELQRLGEQRVEIRLDEPLTDGHARINCTMPAGDALPGERPRWRWFGMQFSVPAL